MQRAPLTGARLRLSPLRKVTPAESLSPDDVSLEHPRRAQHSSGNHAVRTAQHDKRQRRQPTTSKTCDALTTTTSTVCMCSKRRVRSWEHVEILVWAREMHTTATRRPFHAPPPLPEMFGWGGCKHIQPAENTRRVTAVTCLPRHGVASCARRKTVRNQLSMAVEFGSAYRGEVGSPGHTHRT